MKVSIIFHSVCGNTYLMARAFDDGLRALGHDTELLRVPDSLWSEKPDLPDTARKTLLTMRALPEAGPDALRDADLVILGSPTHFGNVSAQMKAFMDATGGLWFHGKLVGKKLFAFASAGNTEGGGDLCLQAIQTYGQYMGMLNVPVPVTLVPGESWPALGIVQYSGGKYAATLDEKTARAIEKACAFLSGI